ncbi:biosynthetic arginine decarboxylase [Kordiimonas sediminis]|uniref:Arginine decarboxylase n=1 Tax=Kordiimonas sediminis TaxID=1735581 RepID=A0A919APS4_9PROT|nr:biosynthetic arginine decarboxylase [Kordiimonas sediminis]GHF19330.1 biosynthetic arginine decarboxylase [Kordiimonas sediminis]
MATWTIKDSNDLYRISQWGDGYYGISDAGLLTVYPKRENQSVRIPIGEVVEELREKNIQFPVVIRFLDVLCSRVQRLNRAFGDAIADQNYGGAYRGVYPIKVNQMREVVDEIVSAGEPYHYGLEAGSKPELMAVLSCDLSAEALTICNGYKDEEFLRLALLGRKFGRKVIVVVEKFSEIKPLLRLAREMDCKPMIGMRVKMRVKTGGRWSASSGERAKFGLSVSEMLQAIDLIRSEGFGDCIDLLHFHVGSQLSDLRYIQEAVEEAARIYARLIKRDVPLKYLDIGGGLAVDYDGSGTNASSSMNYSLEDYASTVVGIVKQVCELEHVEDPNLVSESGRAMVAHHSCVIMEVIGEISTQARLKETNIAADAHYLVRNMLDVYEDLDRDSNFAEAYGNAAKLLEDVLAAFKLGVVGLDQVADAETLYWKILKKVHSNLLQEDGPADLLSELGDLLSSQYLCNFSLFQSAADSWAIDQVLPIAPLARLGEEPTNDCTLVDITCDSDGKISNFIGDGGQATTLPLHTLGGSEPYYIGLFMTGAYQDVMGDMHNLFGRLSEAHVFCDEDDPTDFYIEEYIRGSSSAQVLQSMQYNPDSMAQFVKKKIDAEVKRGTIKARDGVGLVDFYEDCLRGDTYLKP